MIVYKGVLTVLQWQQVAGYLVRKRWSSGSVLPTTHPFFYLPLGAFTPVQVIGFSFLSRQSRHLIKFGGYVSQWVNQSSYANTVILRISSYQLSYTSVGPCLTCECVNSGALSMSYGFVSYLLLFWIAQTTTKTDKFQYFNGFRWCTAFKYSITQNKLTADTMYTHLRWAWSCAKNGWLRLLGNKISCDEK